MRIALIADPYIPVPPNLYGGIERIVDMLVDGYLKGGHSVTLFAHPDSKTPCRLIPYGISPHKGFIIRARELLQIMDLLNKTRDEFDIIHSFGRLASMFPLYFSRIPKIQSYQRSISRRNVLIATALAGKSIFFTASSDSCRRSKDLPGRWKTIYNGIPLERFEFSGHVAEDAPLVFLGRIEEIKGCHIAIDVALSMKKKLVIAGNIVKEGKSYLYFKELIEPRIDGIQIVYAGEVDDKKKSDILKNSSALLMPVLWEEPFGIVMAEALACGTPVIGFARGSVPEVIEENVTGFICDTKEAMCAAVNKIYRISRERCRKSAEERFSDNVIISEYLKLYESMIRHSIKQDRQ